MSNNSAEEEAGKGKELKLPADNLLQLLFVLPPQLLSFLVICAKPIYLLSQLSQILRWSHPLGPYPSWILLFTYIAIVSSFPICLRLAIPNILTAALLTINLLLIRKNTKQAPNHSSSHPVAVLDCLQSFQILLNHYADITSYLQPIYQLVVCSDPDSSIQAIKTCLTSIPFTILISYLVSPQQLILVLGSILIVWSSKWFQLLINLLWRSILLRLSVTLLIDLCFRAQFRPIDRLHQLDPTLQHRQSTQLFYSTLSYLRTLLKFYSPNLYHPRNDSSDKSDTSYVVDASRDIEFCLTIFENQRWWMGLDWTSNLLPHERPNWADSLNHPVPSPANITLPSPKTFKDPSQSLQTRVEWKWMDSDWKIIEAHPTKDDDHGVQDDETLKSTSTSTIADRSSDLTSNHTPPCSPNSSFRRHQNRSSASYSGSSACLSACLDSEIIDESLRTSGLNASIIGPKRDPTKPWEVDGNGWQYGDNHWEKMSKKSGIGKYTRRRAWARKVCLVTRLEPLEDDTDTSPNQHPPIISSPNSDSATTLLQHISQQSINQDHASSTSSSSSSIIKSKKSFGLLRRNKIK